MGDMNLQRWGLECKLSAESFGFKCYLSLKCYLILFNYISRIIRGYVWCSLNSVRELKNNLEDLFFLISEQNN